MRLLVLSLCLATAAPAIAQDDPAATTQWPQFLGTGAAARAHGASTLGFAEEDRRYRVEIPTGRSSPCIWNDRIYLSGVQSDGKLATFALDRATGKELWRHTLPAPKRIEFAHIDAGVAQPTACTNGTHVYFYLPSYGLVAYDLDGELVWEKKLPEPSPDFGLGSSPVLHEGMLFLLRDGCPDAALYALDDESGEELWTVQRLAFSDSHTTPFIWNNRDRTELIVASTGAVVSYSPADGKEIWRVEGLTPLVCTTPTASVDRLYFAGWSTPAAAGADRLLAGMEEPITITDDERKNPALLFKRFDTDGDGKISYDEMPEGRGKVVYSMFDQNQDDGVDVDEWTPLFEMPVMGKNLLIAIRPGGEGNVTDTHVEWSERRGIPYVSSPLLYDGRLYMIKAGGILSCLDAGTGKPRFRRARLDDHSEYYATPLGVDGHVLVCSSAGTLYVLEAADELKIVKTVEFDERIFATPAVADGTIYLRTGDALYAYGRGE